MMLQLDYSQQQPFNSNMGKNKIKLCFREFITILTTIANIAYPYQTPCKRVIRLLVFMEKSGNLTRMSQTGKMEGVGRSMHNSITSALVFKFDSIDEEGLKMIVEKGESEVDGDSLVLSLSSDLKVNNTINSNDNHASHANNDFGGDDGHCINGHRNGNSNNDSDSKNDIISNKTKDLRKDISDIMIKRAEESELKNKENSTYTTGNNNSSISTINSNMNDTNSSFSTFTSSPTINDIPKSTTVKKDKNCEQLEKILKQRKDEEEEEEIEKERRRKIIFQNNKNLLKIKQEKMLLELELEKTRKLYTYSTHENAQLGSVLTGKRDLFVWL